MGRPVTRMQRVACRDDRQHGQALAREALDEGEARWEGQTKVVDRVLPAGTGMASGVAEVHVGCLR